MFSEGDFVTVQCEESIKEDDANNTGELDEEEHDGKIDDNTSELFPCPCDGCILSYKRHLNLEHHLLYGKCKLRQERYTLLDRAKMEYTKKVMEGTSTRPLISSTTSTSTGTRALHQGWALKIAKKTARFNDNQKSYLDEKFDLGIASGCKADPAVVARDLRLARNGCGQRRFKIDEFLTAQQIKSYFSRKAAKIRKSKDVVLNDASAEDQTAYCSTRERIIQECHLVHPIMFDTYDICDLHAEKKLKKLNVSLLRQICLFYDMDAAANLSLHRKAPYISLISTLVESCSCSN